MSPSCFLFNRHLVSSANQSNRSVPGTTSDVDSSILCAMNTSSQKRSNPRVAHSRGTRLDCCPFLHLVCFKTLTFRQCVETVSVRNSTVFQHQGQTDQFRSNRTRPPLKTELTKRELWKKNFVLWVSLV